ncbi:MAG TPA: phenylacetyl-CoA:acceptor oxidoreductase [Rhodocyclaceae bacterium]|nr:phenylacetyl-CoA:acceptor oxidoreductase [Rhodocyclaceae bacterium]
MSTAKFGRFGTAHQTSWDWRAAANFIGGGTGSALLALTVLVSLPGAADGPLALIALAFIGAGLACVWMEIGRPWRAFNVLFHPQTSWMTREAYIAALIVVLFAASFVTGAAPASFAAGLAALLFLYAQARILRAARGIPAWREPAVVPLIIATGLVEGMSVLVLVQIVRGGATGWALALLFALVAGRGLAWTRYRSALLASDAPRSTRATLETMHRSLLFAGTAAPLVAAAIGVVAPGTVAVMGTVAALAALGAGWHAKFLLVVRAAQVQGYALGNKLRRGHPLAAR